MRTVVLCMTIMIVCVSCSRRSPEPNEVPSGKVLSVAYPVKVMSSDEDTTVVVSKFVTVIIRGVVVLPDGRWWMHMNYVDEYVRFTNDQRGSHPDIIYPLIWRKSIEDDF